MVPAFNMLDRGNRLHGKGFGMMQNLVDPSALIQDQTLL
jgi:hypothetical protein